MHDYHGIFASVIVIDDVLDYSIHLAHTLRVLNCFTVSFIRQSRGKFCKKLQPKNKQLISVTFLVSNFEISEKFFNELHPENIHFILIIGLFTINIILIVFFLF
jgi:hypothetical protein